MSKTQESNYPQQQQPPAYNPNPTGFNPTPVYPTNVNPAGVYPNQQGVYPGPPPQQQGFNPQGQQLPPPPPGPTVISVAPYGYNPAVRSHGLTTQLPPNETRLTCPSCNESITTKVDYKASTRTHIVAFIMCTLMLWLCCWIPYVTKSCKNANHYCPNCGAFIGTAMNV